MITLTLFDLAFPISEKDAKQFARDIAVLLDGGGEKATLPQRITVSRIEDGAFRVWYNLRNRPALLGLSVAEVATEALKLTKTSLDPQKKVIAALTKHLPRTGVLL